MEQETSVYLGPEDVKKLLTWNMINEAVEEAMKSIVNDSKTEIDEPFASQPNRSVTQCGSPSKILLCMPSYVGNFKLTDPSAKNKAEKKTLSSLGCKMVSSFRGNEQRAPPLPNILAHILLFDTETGQFRCIMDATQITAWRTAGASLVATKYLYFARHLAEMHRTIKVAIIGCGVQGQSHAMGMCATFNVSDIYLWNRTSSKAIALAENLRANFPKTNVLVMSTAAKAVEHADVINVGTYASEALVTRAMIKKPNVHINTVGAGEVHWGEVAQDIYDCATVYVDSCQSAKTELAGLQANIVSEVGEVIRSKQYPKAEGITIFQSMGMAVEDVTVAEAVLAAYENSKSIEKLKK